MNILVAHSGNIFGGIERVLLNLVAGMKEIGVEPPLFALAYRDRLWEELSDIGCELVGLDEIHFSKPWTISRGARQVAELCRHREIDVGVTLSPWGHSIFGRALRRNCCLVHWQHGIYDGRHPLERLAARIKPAGVIVNSHFTEESTASVFPDAQTVVAYNPVVPLVGPGPGSPEGATVAHVARLDPGKGQSVTIEAVSIARNSIPHIRSVIAASPQSESEERYLRDLRKQVDELGAAEWTALVRQPVGEILSGADIFCHPNTTHRESFGVSFVEAMYAGLPVITTDFGAASEVVGECGILVADPTPDSVAQAIVTLLEGDLDRYREIGPRRAREISDPATCAREFCDALARFLH